MKLLETFCNDVYISPSCHCLKSFAVVSATAFKDIGWKTASDSIHSFCFPQPLFSTLCSAFLTRASRQHTDWRLNGYIDHSHFVPSRFSSPRSRSPHKPIDGCAAHPKWTNGKRWKNEALCGLVRVSLCLLKNACIFFVLTKVEVYCILSTM